MATEVAIQMANHFLKNRLDGSDATLGQWATTAIEPPSAVYAMQRLVGASKPEVIGVPSPDARDLMAPVSYQVWRYDGRTALPAQKPPSPEAAELLREVANLTWTDPVSGYAQAARLGELSLSDLLGLLAAMPSPPDNQRWQAVRASGSPAYWHRLAPPWVCLGILHHRVDEPWDTSTRRKVLVDLVNGVEDWATDSALFALVVQAWNEPACRDDVLMIVRRRFLQARWTTARRLMTIAPSIAELLLITPGASELDRTRARRLIRYTAKPSGGRFTRWWRTHRLMR